MSDKKAVHIWMDTDTGEISISGYHVDDENYETNHMKLVELRSNGQINKHESALNVLRNVLSDAGVTVEFD